MRHRFETTCDAMHRIMHVIYTEKDIGSPLYSAILEEADRYEGVVKRRTGVNLPMTPDVAVRIGLPENVDYVIMYREGDRQTLAHEQMHVRYYFDPMRQEEVRWKWKHATEGYRQRVTKMLMRMGYDVGREEILLDEWQAYAGTEADNFFGAPDRV